MSSCGHKTVRALCSRVLKDIWGSDIIADFQKGEGDGQEEQSSRRTSKPGKLGTREGRGLGLLSAGKAEGSMKTPGAPRMQGANAGRPDLCAAAIKRRQSLHILAGGQK